MGGWECEEWVGGCGSVECCGRIKVWRVGEWMGVLSVGGGITVCRVGWWMGVWSVECGGVGRFVKCGWVGRSKY